MAEKGGLTFGSIMKDLQSGKVAPVYLLHGEEAYYIDQIADWIAANLLTEDEQFYNLNVMFGADVTAAQVADTARSMPLMATRRVVVVKEAQDVGSWDKLGEYLASPSASTVLVLCHKHKKIDSRKAWFKKKSSACVVFESAKIKDYQLGAFIGKYLSDRKVTIDNRATAMLADHVGADLSRMAGELDKLIHDMGEGERGITADMVSRKIGVSKEFAPFEMKSALAEKNVQKAMRILKYYNSNPKAGSSFQLVPILYKFFQELFLAYYSPDKSERGVAAYLEMNSVWTVKDHMTAMRKYSAVKVMQILHKIREVDAMSKGLDNGNTPIEQLMEDLIFFILH